MNLVFFSDIQRCSNHYFFRCIKIKVFSHVLPSCYLEYNLLFPDVPFYRATFLLIFHLRFFGINIHKWDWALVIFVLYCIGNILIPMLGVIHMFRKCPLSSLLWNGLYSIAIYLKLLVNFWDKCLLLFSFLGTQGHKYIPDNFL